MSAPEATAQLLRLAFIPAAGSIATDYNVTHDPEG